MLLHLLSVHSIVYDWEVLIRNIKLEAPEVVQPPQPLQSRSYPTHETNQH